MPVSMLLCCWRVSTTTGWTRRVADLVATCVGLHNPSSGVLHKPTAPAGSRVSRSAVLCRSVDGAAVASKVHAGDMCVARGMELRFIGPLGRRGAAREPVHVDTWGAPSQRMSARRRQRSRVHCSPLSAPMACARTHHVHAPSAVRIEPRLEQNTDWSVGGARSITGTGSGRPSITSAAALRASTPGRTAHSAAAPSSLGAPAPVARPRPRTSRALRSTQRMIRVVLVVIPVDRGIGSVGGRSGGGVREPPGGQSEGRPKFRTEMS